MQEKNRLAAKEKISSLSRIRGYAKDSGEGTVKVRVHLGERGGVDEEHVLRIKAHPSSRVCDLYETVQNVCASLGILQHRKKIKNENRDVEQRAVSETQSHQYYLEDREGRRMPRDGEEGSKSMTFASLGGEKGKVFRVFQRVTKATECYVVRALAEKIVSSPAHWSRLMQR